MYGRGTGLVTHTHADHFNLPALLEKNDATRTNAKPLAIALSASAQEYIEGTIAHLALSSGNTSRIKKLIELQPLDYFKEYEIGGFSVRTVKANHTAHGVDEYAINYLINLHNGRLLLYACDTGYYSEETWEYLKGSRVDTLILECTYAGRTDQAEFPRDHLDLLSYAKMLKRMSDIGFIDDRSTVYANHINPHQGFITTRFRIA